MASVSGGHMAKVARDRLARLLGDAGPAGSFGAQMLAPAHLLQLEVSGVGPVSLPVRAPLAKKLITVARSGRFGRREKTLTDTSVGDTWELTPDQVTLGGPLLAALMNGALEHFRDELGLPQTSRLRAELHSMLVYGKGQFFLPHQDSEKHDAMVGTLVVSLPSAHTGGELVIVHAGESRAYRASREELTFVAFYADCRHQVTPVRSGYRVTLTFNLLADADPPAGEAGPDAELAHCLTEHFATPATLRYGGRDLDPPRRLVFLLDHEYTQRGLNWRRLKGADAERAALVRAAAEQAGCETVLALAEVKETWDALPSDSDQRDGYDYDEDEDDGYRDTVEAPDEFQLNELIDGEITLGWWTGPDGADGEPISLHVPDHEVCATTPNADLEPYKSEYEGYMGNYGNTLDRWYRRAAVVLWPRNRAFAARAEAGSQWALRELRDRIEAGDLEGARAAAEIARAVLEKDRGAGGGGTARCRAGRGGGPGRCWDGGDVAGAVPGGDGRAGACGRAGGSGRAVRPGVDAGRHRPVVRARAPLRDRPARVDQRPVAGAVRGVACRRTVGDGAAAGRASLALDGRPAPALEHHCAQRGPPAAAGDAEPTAGATDEGSRRHAA